MGTDYQWPYMNCPIVHFHIHVQLRPVYPTINTNIRYLPIFFKGVQNPFKESVTYE